MLACPFCQPSDEDVILLNDGGVIALCDARPILAGHVLIASRSHIPSVLDLSEAERTTVRQIQERVTSAVRAAFGDVGAYEHGRSAVCRFGMIDGGHLHAHVHLLPVAFDLITMAGGHLSPSPPRELRDRRELRYLYQKLGTGGAESWHTAYGFNVPRHFVRSAAQEEFSRRAIPWLEVNSDPVLHEEAIAATAASIKAELALGTSAAPGAQESPK